MFNFRKKAKLKELNFVKTEFIKRLEVNIKNGIRNLDYINSKTSINTKGEIDFVIEVIYTRKSGESFYECLGSDGLTVLDYIHKSELLGLICSNFVEDKRVLRGELVFLETFLDLDFLRNTITVEGYKKKKYFGRELYPCFSARCLKLNNFKTVFPDLEKRVDNIDELKKEILKYKNNINETLIFIDDIDFSIVVFELNEIYDEFIKNTKYERYYNDFKELFYSASLIIGGFIKDKENKESRLKQLKDVLNKCDNILKKES